MNEQHLTQEQEIQQTQSTTKNWEEVAARPKNDDNSTEEMLQTELLTADLPKELLEHPTYVEMLEVLNRTEQERETYKQKTLLAAADMENARRRFDRDLANAHKYAITKLLEELVPVIDSLERGLELNGNSLNTNEWLQQMRSGMQLTLEMLLKTLQKHGVEQLNPVGELFNPTYHEAIAVQNDPNVAENTILRVVQKGYLLKERVIRPAMVLVSKNS